MSDFFTLSIVSHRRDTVVFGLGIVLLGRKYQDYVISVIEVLAYLIGAERAYNGKVLPVYAIIRIKKVVGGCEGSKMAPISVYHLLGYPIGIAHKGISSSLSFNFSLITSPFMPNTKEVPKFNALVIK